MKSLSLLALAVLAFGLVSATLPSFAAEPYLFEMLNRPTYQKAWNGLFVAEKDIDVWLAKYAKTKNGPAGPGAIVVIGNKRYQANTVCKPHDCEDNRFVVLFAPDEAKAWGMLLKNQRDERYFGHPDEEVKKALRAAAHE